MNESAANAVKRHPLLELLGQVQGLDWSIRQLITAVPKLTHYVERWTLCFHGDGSLAGIVDRCDWCPDSDRMPSLQSFWTERRSKLAAAGWLDRDEVFVCGDGLEGPEWDSRAAENGVKLPRLARPLDTSSNAFDEAFYAADDYREALVTGNLDISEPSSEAIGGKLAIAVVDASALADAIESVLQLIGFVREHAERATEAGQRLPAEILTALDGLDGSGWRARFRRDVLGAASRWPDGSPDQDDALPRHGEDLVRLVSSNDPRERWQELLPTINRFATDLRSASSEIGADSPGLTPLPNDEPDKQPLANGPIVPEGWSYDGRVYLGLTPTLWLFGKALWDACPRGVTYDSLEESVPRDHARSVTQDRAGNWRRDLNKFFRGNGIPLETSTPRTGAILRKLPEYHETTA